MSTKKPTVELDDPFELEPFVQEKESFRPRKVASRIREELLLLVPDSINDPKLKKLGSISITEVVCAQDLRNARVMFTMLGADDVPEEERGNRARAAETLLNGAAGYLRRELSEKLGIKYTPILSFHFDRGLVHAMKIRELLKKSGVAETSHAEPKKSSDDDQA